VRRGFRGAVTGVVAAGLLLAGTATAGADEATVQDCRPGSRSGTTTISGALLQYDICIEPYGANINLYLEDTAKDGRRAEAWLVTSLNEYEIFEVTGGQGDWATDWLFVQEAYVKVKVCTSEAGTPRQ